MGPLNGRVSSVLPPTDAGKPGVGCVSATADRTTVCATPPDKDPRKAATMLSALLSNAFPKTADQYLEEPGSDALRPDAATPQTPNLAAAAVSSAEPTARGAAPSTTPAPLELELRGLLERLAARVSCSIEELEAFPTVAQCLDRVAASLFAGRRVVIARPAGEAIAARAWSSARVAREVDAQPFDALVAAARDAEVLVLSSPVVGADGRARAAITPRELLLLRSRAPRPVIVLDLLDEELARTPLTQPALLLPGTVIVRGFGDLWRGAGAADVAGLAFIAGPADLVAQVADGGGTGDAWATARSSGDLGADGDPLLLRAIADLDRPGIDRAVQEAASALRTAR